MERFLVNGLVFVRLPLFEMHLIPCDFFLANCWNTGQLDREGNARKVVNCSCVVVKDWGEESQERSVLLNYFQTSQ